MDIISGYEKLFLVDLKIGGVTGNKKIQILADGMPAISIDECAEISRKLGSMIEELELIDSKYILEVSSPGLDAPLKLKQQYVKNVGRKLKVELMNGEQLSGMLKKYENDSITLEMGKSNQIVNKELTLNEIRKSKVIVSFK